MRFGFDESIMLASGIRMGLGILEALVTQHIPHRRSRLDNPHANAHRRQTRPRFPRDSSGGKFTGGVTFVDATRFTTVSGAWSALKYGNPASTRKMSTPSRAAGSLVSTKTAWKAAWTHCWFSDIAVGGHPAKMISVPVSHQPVDVRYPADEG